MAKYREIEESLEKEKKDKEKFYEQQSKVKVLLDHPQKGLDMIYSGELKTEDIPTYNFLRQVSSLKSSLGSSPFVKQEHRKIFYKIISHLIKQKSEILEYNVHNSNEFLSFIFVVCEYEIFFVRDFSTWEKGSRNVHKQFRDIIDHLFVDKKVPEFMYSVWGNASVINHKYISWFVLMGAGGSIKNEKNLPANFTKKMLHHFMHAPGDFSVDEALMYGRVRALGGDEGLCNIISSSAMRSLNMNDFWESVITFFKIQ